MTTKLFVPDGNAKLPGVVLIHEWWGVNEQIQSLGQRWADAGFICAVPDLYGGKVVPIGDSASAQAAMQALDFPKAVQQIAATVKELQGNPRCAGRVAVTGYCMGGALTLASAVNIRGLACAVPFYGYPGDLDWKQIDAPVMAHFAKHDDWAKIELAEKVKAGVIVPMQLHVYDAQHAFCNDKRPEVYDAEAAKLAWDRSVAFVRAETT